MMLAALISAMMMTSTPATLPTVETGVTEWSKLPKVKKRDRALELSPMIDWTQKALASGECKIKGMNERKFDVDVPYAVLVEPNGTVKRIVIAETGCSSLNTLIGSTIFDWVQKGDFKPTGEDEPLWFGDRIAFAHE